MITGNEAVTKKYAKALLNLYFDAMKPECFNTLIELDAYFKKHKAVVRYLCIPSVADSIKKQVIEKVFASLDVCATIKRLIIPLLKQRRIELLEEIVAQVIDFYRLRVGEVIFYVATSHSISDVEQNHIISFLSKEVGAQVKAEFTIDKTLLSGFRAESRTLLYERSIRKKLRDAHISFNERIKS